MPKNELCILTFPKENFSGRNYFEKLLLHTRISSDGESRCENNGKCNGAICEKFYHEQLLSGN